MEMQSYISQIKEHQKILVEFLENVEISDSDFQNILDYTKDQEYLKSRDDFKLFLRLLLNISNNHHRNLNFIQKIKNIIKSFESIIKITLNNDDIFEIFQTNKLILLFLIENKLFEFDEIMIKNIESFDRKEKQYFYYFYPEIKTIIDNKVKEKIEKELMSQNSNIFNTFNENRQIGENDSYICSLIREDSVEEFITYVNKNNIKLTTEISHSIFETNDFLIENESTTLIEYSAFYGSIQIFQYMLLNNVELTPSLWLYVIHSKNAELIHLLEENDVEPPDNNYEICLFEAIKCHHNDIANYIKLNLIDPNIDKSKRKIFIEKVFECSFHYSNFSYFPNEIKLNFLFFYLCMYDYTTLVNLFLKMKKNNLETSTHEKIILNFK